MDTKRRQLFEAYFQQQVERGNAFSLGDKLTLVDRLYHDASEQGLVPFAPGQVARVPAHSPRVQAILEGKEIALGGKTIQGQQTFQQRLATLSPVHKIFILILVFFLPALGMWGFGRYQESAALAAMALTGTPTETPTQTETPTPTPRPGSFVPTATPYALVLDNAAVPQKPYDPVSISFANVAFTLGVAQLDEGEWRPAVAEWLPGTEVRRVIAVPYTLEVGNAVATLTYGSEITLRLLSGEVVVYRLVDIQRLQRHAIEVLNALIPSLVIVLHGERAGQRWLLLAEAEQGRDLPPLTATPTITPTPTSSPSPTSEVSPTSTGTFDPNGFPTDHPSTLTPIPTHTIMPTITPTPTATHTPALAFTPPIPVTEVFTDTHLVVNDAAGLQLTILNCAKVAQIGRNEGAFVVCDVTITALREEVGYSNDTLAISELSQVLQIPGWWPSPLSVVGSIGNGQLANAGEMVSGKVAGAIAKKQSEPVLIWEQAGLRFVITLEELLDE